MDNTNSSTPPRWGSRIVGLIVCAAFALAFGGVGLMAIWQLGAIGHAAWQARHWEPVPIEVLEASLQARRDHDGDTTSAVQARYRYEWQGRSYESSQVGLPGGLTSDNFDPWHQDWAERLNRARDSSERLLAWVDPQQPSRAVLDRAVRWRQLLFLLPFAIVFSLVGVGAVAAGWLMMRNQPAMPAAVTQRQRSPRHQALGAWCIAIFWCGIAFPVAGLFWTGRNMPGWASLLVGLFVCVGFVLLWAALQASRLAWIYSGATAQWRPAEPVAGTSFEVSWRLPARAAERWHEQGRLRLAQYRIDDSGSGVSERCVEDIEAEVHPCPAPDGSLMLQARFELPPDAPGQGSRRDKEKVEWRLELVDSSGSVDLALPVAVRSDSVASASQPDRFARSPRGTQELDLPAEAAPEHMPELPGGVQLVERPDAVSLNFRATTWRWVGGVALLGALGLCRSWALGGYAADLILGAGLMAVALHALSARWTLEVRDDGLQLERCSWLWVRVTPLPAESLDRLYRRSDRHQALFTRWPGLGAGTRLTPNLPQGSDAARIARLLRWAHQQRQHRFSPGGQRSDVAHRSRPNWGWLPWVAWLIVQALL